jgi:hypothetical protein
MAFALKSLIRHASSPYGTAPAQVNFYAYATADALATVLAAGYFNAARDPLKVGDVIQVIAVLGGTPDFATLKVLTVPASPSNITVSRAAESNVVGDNVIASLTAAVLTDNSGGTADATLALIPVITDSPATADALRDDIVANVVPVLKNNFADLAAMVNKNTADMAALRAALLASGFSTT